MKRSRKICFVTGSRAEYSHLFWVMQGVSSAPDLEFQLVVTGMHLSPEFGYTFHEIERDGFEINKKVEMTISADSASGVAKSIGIGILGLTDAFDDLQPDIVVLLGDRFEMLSAGISALSLGIPIAHIHGGEITHGAIDDSMRHALTKFASVHFVATDTYARRVRQLGECPDRVYNYGAPCMDAISNVTKINKNELERYLGIQLGDRSLLITFHPETAGNCRPVEDLQELLLVLDKIENVSLVFTRTNSDETGRALNRLVDEFVDNNPRSACVVPSLGLSRFYSLLEHVEGVIGNSSSGIIEAPSFGIGTVNIGTRQAGRAKATSVVDCEAEAGQIQAAIKKILSSEFQIEAKTVDNPYGGPGASDRIVSTLRDLRLENLTRKEFRDLSDLDYAAVSRMQ